MKAHLADLLRPALNDAGPMDQVPSMTAASSLWAATLQKTLTRTFRLQELGLDKEFGLASLSVPLHLLQNRMHNAYQAQNTKYNTLSIFSVAFWLTFYP
jgi:transcriptional activator SPT7